MTTPTEPLQFDVAEDVAQSAPAAAGTGDVRCVACQFPGPLRSYFDVNGKPLCERCKDALLAHESRPHLGTFLKASFLGLCGAAIGAGLFYGIVALTGYQLGLVSIVVGLLVGFAVRRGSGGRGGRRYQVLAVGLTYAAICSTYLPFIFKELATRKASAQTAAQTTGNQGTTEMQGAAAEQGTTAEPPGEPMTLVQFLGGVAFLAALTLALPFLGGVNNIMGLIIIAIALWEAWKVNRKVPLVVSGPLAVGAPTNG